MNCTSHRWAIQLEGTIQATSFCCCRCGRRCPALGVQPSKLCGALCNAFLTTALQEHVIELGKLALDCLIISELDLGRVCHCLGEPCIGRAVTGT
jgi:hypothetical protein